MPKNFAEALVAQLERVGITPYRLSQLTGISKSTISKFLNNKVQPGWDSVQKIAKALGVTCEAFAADDVPLPEPPDERGRGRPKETGEQSGEDEIKSEPKATTKVKKKKK